ncbi:HEAT repeat domain-containing protein [Acanthopleuribacter pedis]|uniref:TIGR02270 family protein n=1 Tax=Acanthopleuribacter pedis TaxID=442870 RepID=A0A8J7QBL4_9BACT|nr:HEAT repeat domain-containing protein [Acanthopleuribacter pedis]MBO1317951.1 hypothetical protein [Acanthopleuribacter pedis]
MMTPLHAHAGAADFYDDLLSDHFEEIEWLLEHRDALFRDGDLDWPEVDTFEERLWPKLEVLLGHGERGLAIAEEAAEGVVEDSARAGVFILAHRREGLAMLAAHADHDELEEDQEADFLIAHWFRGLEVGDADAVAALLEQKATSPHPSVRRHCARLIGYRRLQNRDLLQRLLADKVVGVQAEATLAAAKMGLTGVLEFAERGQRHAFDRGDTHSADLFALAQFLLGGKGPIHAARTRVKAGETLSQLEWALMAMAGDPADLPLLQQQGQQGEDANLHYLLLGIHGDAAVIPKLIAALASSAATAEAAADALYILTGAPLFNERWIAVPDNHVVALNRDLFPPDPTDLAWQDEDEAEDEEEEEPEEDEDADSPWDDAEDAEIESSLARADHDDAAFDANDGFHRRGIDTDASRWRVWLEQNGSSFQPGRRYRRGKAYGIAPLIDEIVDPTSPFDSRRRALWELAFLQQPSPGLLFEPDWWIRQQQPFVTWLKQWLEQQLQ